MAISRTLKWDDINRALDELIHHEEGVRFQRLAIALAKQRWSELIAMEIKKDGGEDALTHSFLTKEGKRISVASSITATYPKVGGDAERIYSRGIILDLLVFYTSKVSNTTVDGWRNKIKKKFGCDLVVITKEDIIQELLKPENHSICSTLLRLDVPVDQAVTGIAEKAKSVSSKMIEQWKKKLIRFSPSYLADIETVKLDEKHRPAKEMFDHDAICATLCNGGRIILLGASGAGKTTTLLQIFERLLKQEKPKVPMLISLPEWIESGKDILAFVAQHPDFLAMNIDGLVKSLFLPSYEKGSIFWTFSLLFVVVVVLLFQQ